MIQCMSLRLAHPWRLGTIFENGSVEDIFVIFELFMVVSYKDSLQFSMRETWSMLFFSLTMHESSILSALFSINQLHHEYYTFKLLVRLNSDE